MVGAGAGSSPVPLYDHPFHSYPHPRVSQHLLLTLCPCPPDHRFESHHPQPTALPVPFVPGALLLQGVLSAAECQQIITAAEAIGWHSDVDYTFGGAAGDDGGRQQQQQHNHSLDTPTPQQQQQDKAQQQGQTQQLQQQDKSQLGNFQQEQEKGKAEGEAAAAAAGGSAARGVAAGLAGLPEGTPAAGCVWLVDDTVLQPLYERVAALLPPEIEGGAYAGINARWRLYRYT